MTGFRCKPERNPLRLLVGLLDFLQKRVAHFTDADQFSIYNLSGALFGCSVILLCIPVLTALYKPHIADVWILFVLFWPVSAPYALYVVASLVWRPVPFFREEEWDFELPHGTYDVVGFGWYLSDNRFFGTHGRAYFHWAKGTMWVGPEGAKVRLSTFANEIFTIAGLVKRTVRAEIGPEAKRGLASLLARRVPAYAFEEKRHKITVAITRHREPVRR